ncbi:hypothetical protein [Oceanisphaera pacifica]|uniref:Antibiotic biosynthesis monooxygenase n=1 Tax=Oceanisphaera pacifica TaxID=2818389 RepID=A0ABS3NIH8_9GAMM|nr:hypothetical protein [Oceanisphaera pacifica]MBO1520127.1 hypothetical protein [Oceanisphaera pacifica]
MSKEERPLLSVIVRRFPKKLMAKIERSLGKTQQAMANQPGFVGLQNSFSHHADYSELVTVFAFDSSESLNQWETSPLRNSFVTELDLYSQDSVTHAQFDDLALLLHPRAQLRKIETVAILIFWILLLGNILRYLADEYLPGLLAPHWRNSILVLINVVLISYVFLPWSSMIATKIKAYCTK